MWCDSTAAPTTVIEDENQNYYTIEYKLEKGFGE